MQLQRRRPGNKQLLCMSGRHFRGGTCCKSRYFHLVLQRKTGRVVPPGKGICTLLGACQTMEELTHSFHSVQWMVRSNSLSADGEGYGGGVVGC